MQHVWDYDVEELKKTRSGRLLLLERQINFGIVDGEKINIVEVKKNWHQLNLEPKRKRLFELLIWGS